MSSALNRGLAGVNAGANVYVTVNSASSDTASNADATHASPSTTGHVAETDGVTGIKTTPSVRLLNIDGSNDPCAVKVSPGTTLKFMSDVACSVGCTLEVDRLGAKSIMKNDGAASAAVVSLGVHLILFDGNVWRLLL